MKAFFQSDRGKVRPLNEDRTTALFNDNKQCLAIVADGMGGHKAGEVASEMTVQALEKAWGKAEKFSTPELAEEWLSQRIKKINKEIYKYSQENSECDGMGTTVVTALCTRDFVTVANVGDSRCYLLNEQGFSQITEDHSLVNELVKSGEITKEAAEYHPRKNMLLRALGTESTVNCDIKTITFEEEDLLLLCSDGLSNKISDHDLEQILQKEVSLQDRVEQMINEANERGGEDNISLVLVRNEGSIKVGEDKC